VLYVGNGVNQADAADDLLKLAEKIGAPVTTTLLGRGAFPGGHALALDMLGCTARLTRTGRFTTPTC
jgi:acetolactate synthase-1/2/3 large subunit